MILWCNFLRSLEVRTDNLLGDDLVYFLFEINEISSVCYGWIEKKSNKPRVCQFCIPYFNFWTLSLEKANIFMRTKVTITNIVVMGVYLEMRSLNW